MTRSEHVQWCKTRALDELAAGSPSNAIASMASDMRKHPETDTPTVSLLIMTILPRADDARAVRSWIEGFN